jgi:hypothetical protein
VFTHIPVKLYDAVCKMRADGISGQRKYLRASIYVSVEYIKLNINDPNVRAFLKFNDAPNSLIQYEFACRQLLIGETLFNLRFIDGFNEFFRRLTTRDIRSAFYELVAARIVFEGGCKIFAKPEILKKGEDFDFFAIRDDERINVEVTALRQETYAVKTALNALNGKRKQLAKGHAAVIFCIVPQSWLYPPLAIRERFSYLARRFFGSTQRINAVVFAGEEARPWDQKGTGGSAPFFTFPFFNKRARHPVRDLSFLSGQIKLTPELRTALATGAPAEVLKPLRSTEFYQWVDSLVP